MFTSNWKFLFYYESVLAEYTRQVIQIGLKQGIYWQEWRTTFMSEIVLVKSDGKTVSQFYVSSPFPSPEEEYASRRLIVDAPDRIPSEMVLSLQ